MILGPLDANGHQALELALVVQDKFFGRDAVLARVLAKVRSDFGVTIVDAEDTRPSWPRVVTGSTGRRLRKQLEVGDRLGTVSQRSTNAIVASCIQRSRLEKKSLARKAYCHHRQ
jgi:hypothetical protein